MTTRHGFNSAKLGQKEQMMVAILVPTLSSFIQIKSDSENILSSLHSQTIMKNIINIDRLYDPSSNPSLY